MLDFETVLIGTLGWTIGDEYLRCVINDHPNGIPPHGRALRGYHCPDDPESLNRTVWQETADQLG